MRIVQLIPGTCDAFYCENCLRDFHLLDALKRLGHEVHMVPLYLPLTADDAASPTDSPIFFGGVNVYLQQKSGLFRRTPRWLDRAFDSRRLLRWAAKKSSMTSAADLGETTLSMLRGEHGRQAKELDRLVAYLAGYEDRPDIVALSNALLLGLARRTKERLGVSIACLLQDEDTFLDGLPEPYGEEAWAAVRERAADVDLFVASSRYYRRVMIERLGLPPERVHAVHGGIDPAGYEVAESPPEPPVVGFLSPAIPEKGLDLLVDAWHTLRQDERLANLKLRAAGGETVGSHPFLEDLRERIDGWGLADEVEILPNLGRPERLEFLRSLSVLAVPIRQGEAFGTYVLEALASGVPVVEPRHGAVAELVEATGGGLLVEPNDPAALAEGLKELLLDPDRARQLAARGRQAVLERFTMDRAAGELVELFMSAGQAEEVTDG